MGCLLALAALAAAGAYLLFIKAQKKALLIHLGAQNSVYTYQDPPSVTSYKLSHTHHATHHTAHHIIHPPHMREATTNTG